METILGIDLGTTNSVVSIIRDNRVEVLREEGEAILPSVVGIDNAGNLLVGAAARNQLLLAPERTVRSIKRRMGTDERVRMGDEDYSPQEISAMILRTLKARAERQLGCPVPKAVITVPAFFGENQREATRQAGEMAGLQVVRIINEPTAASLSYEPHPDRMERLLVYDLGGGTFDVSIVQIEEGVVEVLASHGDTQLGGDDFDQLLLDHVSDQFAQQHGIDLRQSMATRARLLRAVEEAKKQLSFEAVVRIEEEFIAEKNGTALHLDLPIARHEYEDLIEPLLAKTLLCVDESLADAEVKATDIDKVVLVGGVTRTPMVQRLLEDQLGQPLHAEVDPDLCVSMGAAIQGGLIVGADVGPVLVDITPHTLGVQARGLLNGFLSVHAFAPIIKRNSALPANRTESFSTCVDGQERALIAIYQGESRDVRHNQNIGEFTLEGLADVNRGNQIVVRFNLDLNGILQVTACEQATGLEKQLTINNAVNQFRRAGQDAAKTRIDATFDKGSVPATADVPAVGTDVIKADEPLARMIHDAEELITVGRRIAGDAPTQDAEEIESLTGRLRAAIEARQKETIEKLTAQLEDIVFYLQDA